MIHSNSHYYVAAVAVFLGLCFYTFSLAEVPNSQHTLRLEPGESPPEASLVAASWLVGYWEGEGLGGRVEEVWSRPAGTTMMGMFRLIRNGETSFYEIMQLAEIEGSLTLKVRHFNLDFSAWEERESSVAFRLVKVEPDRLYFSGLTIQKDGDDRITIYIVLRRGEEVTEEKLTLRRVAF